MAEKERHPYEINQVIEERQMRNWTPIGKSSIYRILDNLEEEALATSRNELRHGRSLKIFQITDKGLQILREFSYNIISNGRDYYNLFSIALSNIWLLEKSKQLEAFEKAMGQYATHIGVVTPGDLEFKLGNKAVVKDHNQKFKQSWQSTFKHKNYQEEKTA